MKKLLVFFTLLTCTLIMNRGLYAAHNLSCGLYTAEPPFLGSGVTPSTHILLDNSGSMHEHAYKESQITIKVYNQNRKGYVGFNSTNEYYGYYEADKFYDYDTINNRFYENDNGDWYGNFLNWSLMHRIDVVRKVLTGGPYTSVNATHGTYKIERTDGTVIDLVHRGMYHAYDDTIAVPTIGGLTKHMTPFKEKIVLEQWNSASDDFLHIGNVSSVSGTTWTISTWKLQKYSQKVLSEKKYGVLDKFEDSLRFSLFTFDTSIPETEGAHIKHYMGENATFIMDSINTIYPNTNTPLAESLYTICGYIQQKNANTGTPPRYTEGSYKIGANYPDPFYFEQANDTIYCSQQNVVIITDGEPTKDTNLPSFADNYETGYLDDVANWAYTTDMRTNDTTFPGIQNVKLFNVFAFGSGTALLKSASKLSGGILDQNGIPDNYFEAQDGGELEVALTVALNSAQNRVSAGAASSVVSTSRSGQGLLYQSVFYPELGNTKTTEWAGDVFAYWLDDYGLLRQDDGATNFKLDEADSRVIIFSKNGETKACVDGVVTEGVCNGTEESMSDVKFVWQASKWLNDNNLSPLEQRTSLFSDNSKRRIFTWNDASGDGKVIPGEFTDFLPAKVDTICPEAVVNWVRGEEQTGLRSRIVNFGGSDINWRLGDIINSSAVAVGAPAENYDLIWKDSSYTAFYQKYKNRRIMIYFGANDGMLHALNGGHYDPETKQYFKNPDKSNTGIDIGGEMWAYVPYNLLPHLSCLTSPNYQHQYYVDLSPRVFDARIFDKENDPKHPNGWGTILVTGMRFGGDGQQDLVVDGRTFGSAYFIFDITDPEADPIFLGEFTYDSKKPFKFGYTIGAPTLVPVKDTTLGANDPKEPSKNVRWYMVFGTGPETISGASFSNARVLVLPLDQLVDTTDLPPKANKNFPLRLDSSVTANKLSKTTLGFQELPKKNSFVSTDFASVDYNFDFFVDILYYGVTEKGNNKPFTGSLHRLKVEDGPDPKSWNQMKMIDDVGPISGTPNVGFYEKNVWVYFGTGKFWSVSDKTDRSIQTLYGVMEPKKTDKAYNFSNINAGSLVDVTNVQVVNDGFGTLNCTGDCSDIDKVNPKTVFGLRDYIVTTSSADGWRRNLRAGERVLGQPTLFGGLTNFVTYTPNDDVCTYGGNSTLYALYYLTGTAWIENIFGDESTGPNVPFMKELGTGMGTTTSLHIGSQDGTKAFITLDDGTLVEVDEPNLPIKRVRTGKGGWHTIGLD